MITESKIIYNFEFMKQYGVDISGGVPDNATAMEEICRRAYNKGWMDCIATMDGHDTNVGWIPVSERLPENGQDVLIYLAWCRCEIGWLEDGEWCTNEYNVDSDLVDAWMPLPEPYKESD